MVRTLTETVGKVPITIGKKKKYKEYEDVKEAIEEETNKKKEYEEVVRRKDNVEEKKKGYTLKHRVN